MTNNDLWCNKCEASHHPADCPLADKNELERISKELAEEYLCIGKVCKMIESCLIRRRKRGRR